eukprot:3160-Heterococcus_DN1.PRE.9
MAAPSVAHEKSSRACIMHVRRQLHRAMGQYLAFDLATSAYSNSANLSYTCSAQQYRYLP